jgi:hypothetical protein
LKRKLIILGGVLLLGAVAWFGLRSPAPAILATLSRDDQAKVRRVVKHEIWRRAFPSASWAGLKQGAGDLGRLVTEKICAIDEGLPGFVQVQTRSRCGKYYYFLAKQPEGWCVTAKGTKTFMLLPVDREPLHPFLR